MGPDKQKNIDLVLNVFLKLKLNLLVGHVLVGVGGKMAAETRHKTLTTFKDGAGDNTDDDGEGGERSGIERKGVY